MDITDNVSLSTELKFFYQRYAAQKKITNILSIGFYHLDKYSQSALFKGGTRGQRELNKFFY